MELASTRALAAVAALAIVALAAALLQPHEAAPAPPAPAPGLEVLAGAVTEAGDVAVVRADLGGGGGA